MIINIKMNKEKIYEILKTECLTDIFSYLRYMKSRNELSKEDIIEIIGILRNMESVNILEKEEFIKKIIRPLKELMSF